MDMVGERGWDESERVAWKHIHDRKWRPVGNPVWFREAQLCLREPSCWDGMRGREDRGGGQNTLWLTIWQKPKYNTAKLK